MPKHIGKSKAFLFFPERSENEPSQDGSARVNMYHSKAGGMQDEGLWFQSPLSLWGSGSIGRWLLWVWKSQWQQGHHGDFHSVFWTQRLSYETLMYVTLETRQLQKPGIATFPIPKVTKSRQEEGKWFLQRHCFHGDGACCGRKGSGT